MSNRIVGSPAVQAPVSKALLPDGVRAVVEGEILSMGRDAELVGHASVGGVSLIVLDMEPLDANNGRFLCERRWIAFVEEPQASGNRTQITSGIARTFWRERAALDTETAQQSTPSPSPVSPGEVSRG